MADLIVEDGTGLSTADAFMSEDYMDAYATDHDLTGWLDGSGDGPAAIRRATAYVSNSWNFKGYKVNGRLQSLAWPRADVLDEEDNEVDATAVPVEIIHATCELAAYERANPGALTPSVVLGDRAKREKVGPLEIEYMATGSSSEAVRPILLLVEDMLSGLIVMGTSSETSGLAARV